MTATLPDQICIYRRQSDTGEMISRKEARVEAGRHGRQDDGSWGRMGLLGGVRLGLLKKISMSVRCMGAQEGPLQVFTRDSVTCHPDKP